MATAASVPAANAPPAAPPTSSDYYAGLERARAALLGDCRTLSARYDSLRPYDRTNRTETTWALKNWKGGCRDGRRDGPGRFSLRETSREYSGRETGATEVTSADWEGEFVAGVQTGLWCRGPQLRMRGVSGRKPTQSLNAGDAAAQCFLLGGDDNKVDSYMRLADGRWQRLQSGTSRGPIVQLMPAGTVESRSRALIAAARAGEKPPPAGERIVEIPVLADLLPGGRVSLDRPASPVALNTKRVALVFTTRAGAELRRFGGERQKLIDATAAVRAEAPREYAAFLHASDPQRILESLAQALRPSVGALLLRQDLTALESGEVDYAILVDFVLELRPGVLGNYEAVRKTADKLQAPFLITTQRGLLLLDREMRVAAATLNHYAVSSSFIAYEYRDWTHKPQRGDREYLYQLTPQLRKQWGVREPIDSVFDQFHYMLGQYQARSR